MKMIKIILIIIMVLPFQLSANGVNTSSKTYFYTAKQRIEDMLSGKEEMSYERAIYEIENAWWESTIDYSSFNDILNYHTEKIYRLVSVYRDSTKMNFKDDLKGNKEQKRNNYEQALKNYAIYNYMTQYSVWLKEDKMAYHRPYTYVSKDPMGTIDWTNTQVTHLLNENSGNCFALASLYEIFAERINSNANLCTAPGHIYIRHADEKGTFYNVELSSRSFPGTGTLGTITYTTDEAIKNNIAMRELDTRQSIALCLVYLAEGYKHKFGIIDDDFILACADATLKYDDHDLNAMLLKAEVLQARIANQKKNIKELQATVEFQQYQELVTHVFRMGYREMPFDMKNILVKSWMKDTVIQLTLKDNTPSQVSKNKVVSPTRYASLSWGLFDEEIKTKSLERYGNTIFNTKTNKIVAFVESDVLFNQYDFDPVVFAWNVDPMAHKFPHASPYCFVENNPISRIDPSGAEWVNAYSAKVSMLEAQAKTNPNDKSIQRQLKYNRAMEADVNMVLGKMKSNDRALYDYIDNLTIKTTMADGNIVERNVKVNVGTNMRYAGSEQGQSAETTREPSSGGKGDYNGKQIEIPLSKDGEGKRFLGFNVTLYGAEGSSFRDASLANEAGDVMFYMEYNVDAVKGGSDDPKSPSYYEDGKAGNYSSRVESEYNSRSKGSSSGNPYPLPQYKNKK